MSVFRSLLIAGKNELYLIYNTKFLTNERIDFNTTAQMKTWIASNRSSLLGSLKAVRKNVDDNQTDFSFFFFELTGLTSLDLSDFDTTGATTMFEMISSCSGLTSLNVSNLNTSSVTTMYAMIWGCSSLTDLDLSSFDTSNVETMLNMLKKCSNLISLNLSNFDTSSVTDMQDMLQESNNLRFVWWATNKDTVQNILDYSGLGQYGNTIYVPSSLLDDYKSAQYFRDWADQIVGV